MDKWGIREPTVKTCEGDKEVYLAQVPVDI
jgi:hypothetical protein